ncbi:MAG: hypothetical protein CMM07_27600, partial [Rhodopirellula sp.]|nr:hypothetical protein [Rhodopirellula sp.]
MTLHSKVGSSGGWFQRPLVPAAHKKTRPLPKKWPGKIFNESAVSAIANVGEKRLAPPAHGFVGALERHDCVNTEL